MNETISVIVPIYNAEKELKECLNSLIGQTYTNLRILLIDDGSTDRSGAICDAYAAKDKRVEVIHQENSGTIAAQMAGIRALSEEGYTTFCDNDDVMPPDAIEKLWNCAKETKTDIVQGELRRFFGRHLFGQHIYFGKRPRKERKTYTREMLQKHETLTSFLGYITKDSISSGSMFCKLYRNTLLKKGFSFERPARFYQSDVIFNMQIFYEAESMIMTPDIVYFYRVGGGTTKYKPYNVDDAVKIYDFKLKYIEKHGFDSFYRKTVAAELKIELLGFMTSCCKVYRKTPEKAYAEIRRICSLPQVIHAANTPLPWKVDYQEFADALREGDAEKLYPLLVEEGKKNRLQMLAKRILRKI